MNPSLVSRLLLVAGIVCVVGALLIIFQNYRAASAAFPYLRLLFLAMLAGGLFSASHYVKQNN